MGESWNFARPEWWMISLRILSFGHGIDEPWLIAALETIQGSSLHAPFSFRFLFVPGLTWIQKGLLWLDSTIFRKTPFAVVIQPRSSMLLLVVEVVVVLVVIVFYCWSRCGCHVIAEIVLKHQYSSWKVHGTAPHIALYWPFPNLPFGSCAIYFDLGKCFETPRLWECLVCLPACQWTLRQQILRRWEPKQGLLGDFMVAMCFFVW